MTTRTADPTIDQIREIRHRISREHGHDPDRLVAYYAELDKGFGDSLMSRKKATELRHEAGKLAR